GLLLVGIPSRGFSQSNSLDHFTWSILPPEVQAGQGFGSSLEARDLAENRVLGYGGAVTLVGLISNVPPTVLITEVETIQTERVEVANLSSAPVNISGWQLIFYDSQTWPTPK